MELESRPMASRNAPCQLHLMRDGRQKRDRARKQKIMPTTHVWMVMQKFNNTAIKPPSFLEMAKNRAIPY